MQTEIRNFTFATTTPEQCENPGARNSVGEGGGITPGIEYGCTCCSAALIPNNVHGSDTAGTHKSGSNNMSSFTRYIFLASMPLFNRENIISALVSTLLSYSEDPIRSKTADNAEDGTPVWSHRELMGVSLTSSQLLKFDAIDTSFVQSPKDGSEDEDEEECPEMFR